MSVVYVRVHNDAQSMNLGHSHRSILAEILWARGGACVFHGWMMTRLLVNLIHAGGTEAIGNLA